jgi:hypothetical protein
VHQRPALQAREDGTVDRLRVLLAAEDEAGARAGESLVRRRGDEVAVLGRVRVQPGGDEPGEMRHVAEQERADLVGDRAELPRLDRARVGRAAADDQLRPVLLGEREHLVVVDPHRLARDAVMDDRVQPTGEVDLQSVREVAAVREREREDRVTRLERRHVDGLVRRRTRVRLDICVLGPEERLGALDRDRLDLVDDLAAAVVALARVALRVFVRRHRSDRLEDARPREVLRGDQLDLAALALELAREQLGDLGVDLQQAGGAQLLDRFVGDGHGRLLSGWTRDRTRRPGGPCPHRRRPRAARPAPAR